MELSLFRLENLTSSSRLCAENLNVLTEHEEWLKKGIGLWKSEKGHFFIEGHKRKAGGMAVVDFIDDAVAAEFYAGVKNHWADPGEIFSGAELDYIKEAVECM